MNMYLSDDETWVRSKQHLNDLISQAPAKLFENDDLAMHSQKVLEWACIIEPEASFRPLIAAYTHDIDRADKDRVRKKSTESRDEYKKRHQERSANLMKDFLVRIEARPELVQDVYQMILYHDVGDLRTSDELLYNDYRILKDADAITFLQTGFPEYIKKWGVVDTRDRSKSTWDRFTDKAKARPEVIELYHNFNQMLEDEEKRTFQEKNRPEKESGENNSIQT